MKVTIKEGAEKKLNHASGSGADGDAAILSGIHKIYVRSAAKSADSGFFCYLRERRPGGQVQITKNFSDFAGCQDGSDDFHGFHRNVP
jgi:hypothetical protein